MSEEIFPYIGPRPFESNERQVFFGREREIHEIVNLIYANSIVVFYSKSGLGKSSLLNADIIPRLIESGDTEILGPVRIAGHVPEHLASKDLGNIFVINTIASCEKDREDLQQLSYKTLTSYLEERKPIPNSIGCPSARVIIFDQFEELFFMYSLFWEHKKDFFNQLQAALDADYLLRVVFSIREDYLGELDPYLSLLGGKLQARFRLVGLSREDALAAVDAPVKTRGKVLGVGVVEKLVEDLLKVRYPTSDGGYIEKSEQFVDPLQLQLVCSKLWQNLSDDRIVIGEEILATIGNLEQELSTLYEESIQMTVVNTGVEEGDLREWFEKYLIAPEGTRVTARTIVILYGIQL